jgi:hypothetical protein
MLRTGFLPEPIPSIEVHEDRIKLERDKIKERASSSPNVLSPLFGEIKKHAFFAACKELTVEQAAARYEDVFDSGIDEANIPVQLSDVRALAKKLGDSCTSGLVEGMLDDARLFRRWVGDVIEALAERHFRKFSSHPDVVVSVPHLDVPLEDQDNAKVAIVYQDQYDNEDEQYKTVAYVFNIPWPGRHVLRVDESWVDFIVALMRIVCNLPS